MVGAVTSFTTKATCGLARTLRYLALLAIMYPAMSIVPRDALYVNPSGLTWGRPSGAMVARWP